MAPTSKSLSRQKVAFILFQARLFREGKLEKFWADREACKGKAKFGSDECKAMARKSLQIKKDYGWSGAVDEFEREKALRHAPLANRRKEAMAEAQRNKGRSAIEKALLTLDPVASVEQEMAWVRSHPKMTRALTKHLLLGPDEAYTPPKPVLYDLTGVTPPCPSRGAWNTLLSALGNPRKFNDVLLTKQKEAAVTKSSDIADGDTEVIDDLGEVERMLSKAARNDG